MEDRLVELLKRFELHARVFQAGPLCNTTEFYEGDNLGYIHVVKRGAMRVMMRRKVRRTDVEIPNDWREMAMMPARMTTANTWTRNGRSSATIPGNTASPTATAPPWRP
mgnify:CR=1 FL=1